jgi:hypothetical protein
MLTAAASVAMSATRDLGATLLSADPPPRSARKVHNHGGIVMGYRHTDGTYIDGRNELKRQRRRMCIALRGTSGGWKKAVRLLDGHMRAKARGGANT